MKKKDLKYSIKVTKNDSLIGISDFIIPHNSIVKKITSIEKLCTITMSDSTKRVLFGNSNTNINLKINVHATLQFIDKSIDNSKKNENQVQKSINSIEKITSSPRNISSKFNKNFLKDINNNNISNSNSNTENKSPTFAKIKRPVSSITNHKKNRNASASPQHRKFLQKSIQKKNIKEISADKKNLFIEKEEEDEYTLKENSFIDNDIDNEEKKNDNDFIEFIKIFKEKNPLNSLNNISDVNNMLNHTKNIINQLINYQEMYYDRIKKTCDKNKKLKDILMKYNEMYRNIKKKNNALNEKFDNYEMRNYITVNINRNENSNLKEKNIPFKNHEIDLFKELFGYSYDNVNIESKNLELKEKKVNEKKLLIEALKNIINKLGSLNNLLNEKNSTEEERKNANEILDKFNLKNQEINNKENQNIKEKIESNERKNNFENIITNKPDDNDIKLEHYLSYFYSKRNIPKIQFKKTSPNNYEYGSLKVMIKIEGETIRVRHSGKYSLLDNFLESNAQNEIGKKKKTGNSIIKKKPGQK